MGAPAFLYFDLGNVLVLFTVERMCRQMADVAGTDPARVYQLVFDSGLQRQFELGRISETEFYERFCQALGRCVDRQALALAACDIFTLNVTLLPVLAGLCQAGYRLGILSNTCQAHWEHCRRRFRVLEEMFSVHALSYRLGAMKPDAAIFLAAARLARTAPEDIFYTDDLPGHIAGAKSVGFDAVPYSDTPTLVAELRRRGLRFNY